MSEMELVELFGVKAPTFRAAIKAIYKSGMLFPMTTQRCDLACLKVGQHFTTLKWSLHLQLRMFLLLPIKPQQPFLF